MKDIKIQVPNGYLDIDDNIGFGVTYTIDDIKDITKRNSNASKTITLPGSKNNNILMGNLFDINQDFTFFNPNFKTPAKIIVNSTTILDGYLKLNNIKKLNIPDLSGEFIQYEVVVFDSASDFYSQLGEGLLTDISFSGYNHTYTHHNIQSTWDNTYVDGYTYPLMYKGTDTYVTKDFKPAIYHREYLTKIFERAGYELGGSFMDNEIYKKEIIPFNGDLIKLPETEFTRRNFMASVSANTSTIDSIEFYGGISGGTSFQRFNWGGQKPFIWYNDDSTSPNFDNDNHFDISTSTWTIDRNGDYTLEGKAMFKVDWDTKFNFSVVSGGSGSNIIIPITAHGLNSGQQVTISGSSNYNGTYNIASVTTDTITIAIGGGGFVGTDSGTLAYTAYSVGYTQFGFPPNTVYNSQVLNDNQLDGFTVSMHIYKNGVWSTTFTSGAQQYPRNQTFTTNPTFWSGNTWSSSNTFVVPFYRPNIPLLIGDTITIKYSIDNATTGGKKARYQSTSNVSSGYNIVPVNVRSSVLTGTSNTNLSFIKGTAMSGTDLTDGDTIYMDDYIPKKVKQKDLLNDIIKRYNLYIFPDPTNPKKILLQTRDDYYNENTNVLDWTDKKEFGTPDKIELLTELQNKSMLFSDKQDSDDWNKHYKESTGGDEKGNIYGQKKIEWDNEFAQGEGKIETTFSPTPIIYNSLNQRVIVPAIKTVAPKTNIRTLLFNGLKDPINTSGGGGVYSWYWEWTTGSTNEITYYYQYPQALHIDDAIYPTVDINYGDVPYMYYQEMSGLTDNNLYNNYWKNYIEQIDEGRLVTSKFYLNEVDINQIKNSLGTRIFVKDSYYFINKIIDFDPTKEGETTEVQLLKINNGVTFVPSITEWVNPFTSFEANRLVNPVIDDLSNTILSRNVFVSGSNNFVGEGSDGAYVIGDNNVVQDNFRGIVIGTGITVTGDGIWLENASIDSNGIITDLSGNTVCQDEVKTSLITSCDNGNIVVAGTDNPIGINGYNSTIIGGGNNYVSGSYSSIMGSNYSTITGNGSAIIGGGYYGGPYNYSLNIIGDNSIIGGGVRNNINGDYNSILGGTYNRITGSTNTIIGGNNITTIGITNSVIGGNNNHINSGSDIFIGGGRENSTSTVTVASVDYNPSRSVILGGVYNQINGPGYSGILGGSNNTLDYTANNSVIIGGQNIIGYSANTVYIPSISFQNEGTRWFMKEIQIGDWDMDFGVNVNVNHGLSSTEWKTVRGISVTIRDDADTTYWDFFYGGFINTTSTQFQLTLKTSSVFDDPSFNSTSYNRGFITFWYSPDA